MVRHLQHVQNVRACVLDVNRAGLTPEVSCIYKCCKRVRWVLEVDVCLISTTPQECRQGLIHARMACAAAQKGSNTQNRAGTPTRRSRSPSPKQHIHPAASSTQCCNLCNVKCLAAHSILRRRFHRIENEHTHHTHHMRPTQQVQTTILTHTS